MKYSIRRYEKEDFSALTKLMKNCFGMDVDIGYFRWKYLENPAGGVVGYTAIRGKNIVGFLGATPAEYQVDGLKTTIYQAVDLMTHSNFRRQGIFKNLSTAVQNHVTQTLKSFLYAFPESGSASDHGFRKLGWNHECTAPFYFKPRILVKLSSIFHLYQFPETDIKEIQDFSLLEDLVQKSENKERIMLHKKRGFFSWRLANPRFSYRVLGEFNNKELQSYLIYTINERKDLFVIDAFGKNPRLLISQLEKKVLSEKYRSIMTFTNTGTFYQKAISQQAFIYNPFSFGPMNKPLELLTFGNPNINKSWHLTPMDLDCV